MATTSYNTAYTLRANALVLRLPVRVRTQTGDIVPFGHNVVCARNDQRTGRRWARQIGLTAKEFLVVGMVPLNTNIRDLQHLDKLPVVF